MNYIHQAQYYETDQMGIIHHSNYIRWMEEARIAYMDELGFPYKKVEEAGIISPVLSVQCDYKAMTYFGDRVCIDVKLSSFRGVKYEISYEMRDEKTGELRHLLHLLIAILAKMEDHLTLRKSFRNCMQK